MSNKFLDQMDKPSICSKHVGSFLSNSKQTLK